MNIYVIQNYRYGDEPRLEKSAFSKKQEAIDEAKKISRRDHDPSYDDPLEERSFDPPLEGAVFFSSIPEGSTVWVFEVDVT